MTPLKDLTPVNGNMPLWMKFVSAVGVPSVGLLYLVWFLSTTLMSTIVDHTNHHEREMRSLMNVMQMICVNTSETPNQREGCFR
jgi:hypothetical protein